MGPERCDNLTPCLYHHRETGPRCPVDNTRVSNHQLFKDNFAKREVLSLSVKCSAVDCGCPWHGELRNLEVRIYVHMYLRAYANTTSQCMQVYTYMCTFHPPIFSFAVQPHASTCDLVQTDCPNSCGHCCQRKELGTHLLSCMNKPEQCPSCSIHFSHNRMEEHTPHCSSIVVPKSVLSNIVKVLSPVHPATYVS